MVNLDTALGESFLEVPVGETDPQVPANCEHTITSGGKRKPAKADRGTAAGQSGGFSCQQSRCTHSVTAVLLHSVRSRHAEAVADVQDQITRASSWNATASHRFAGSSTASS